MKKGEYGWGRATVNNELMKKKSFLIHYIGLLTLETDNLCTALLVRDLLPGVWLAVAGISFSSFFIVRLRASGNALGRWGWIVGTEPVFKLLLLSLSPILTIPSSSKHSFAKWAPQIMECSVGSKKSARLIWTKLIHWRRILSSFGKKWVECPVLFELLQDPTTHRFTNVKTGKYSCRKLDNTCACKGPKDVFDFRWAEIPLVTSQQRWRNQNGGRSELSEVISRVKMRLYRKKEERFMKYFRYTFYSYQTKL